MKKKHIVSFSGGKDSTALILWAIENLKTFDTIWMDTGWEHEITYRYIDYINKTLLDNKLIKIKSSKYDGFADMVEKRKGIPSTMRRFCTTELKIEPLIEYYDTIRDKYEIHSYVGIRAEESSKRAKMPKKNFDMDYLGVWIHRPILEWKAEDVFIMMDKHNIKPNPLYKMGMKRVGCMPCVMNSHSDMRQIISRFPEVIDEIRDLEQKVDGNFFPPGYIPDRFCSKSKIIEKDIEEEISDPMFGKRQSKIKRTRKAYYPTVDDVVKYLDNHKGQIEMNEEPQSCMSHYQICE